LTRTLIELTVLALGWVLGGTVGVGTVLYAVTIGPLVQVFLPMLTVRPSSAARPETAEAAVPVPVLSAAPEESCKSCA
jgi:uncharacterized membrane protein YczE